MFARIAAILLACDLVAVTGASTRAGVPCSWQQAYAKVLPHGDLEWTPMPFRFEKGASLRYIDFDAGNDENDGTSDRTPWKHHPWDPQATGKARVGSGIHTYVFKGGVDYRGARGRLEEMRAIVDDLDGRRRELYELLVGRQPFRASFTTTDITQAFTRIDSLARNLAFDETRRLPGYWSGHA